MESTPHTTNMSQTNTNKGTKSTRETPVENTNRPVCSQEAPHLSDLIALQITYPQVPTIPYSENHSLLYGTLPEDKSLRKVKPLYSPSKAARIFDRLCCNGSCLVTVSIVICLLLSVVFGISIYQATWLCDNVFKHVAWVLTFGLAPMPTCYSWSYSMGVILGSALFALGYLVIIVLTVITVFGCILCCFYLGHSYYHTLVDLIAICEDQTPIYLSV
jgi:hypothetical protein